MALPAFTTVSTSDVGVTHGNDVGTIYGLRGEGADLEVQLRLYGSDDLRWFTLAELAQVPDWILPVAGLPALPALPPCRPEADGRTPPTPSTTTPKGSLP